MGAKEFSVKVLIGGKIASSLGSAISQAEGKISGMTRHFKAQAAAQKAAISGIADTFKGIAGLAAAGGIAMSMKKALGDGEDLAHEIQGLRNAGRSAHEIAEGMAEANRVIRDMPTGNLTNSIKLLNETTGAFGDYHHAVENLSFNSKLGDVLKNTIGVDDPAHAIGSLIKALEIRGSASNPAKYRREAGELQKAMTFFGGRLTPDMIYTFANNAQQGVRQLNERFLTKIAPSLIQEMGGDKVGTGLTAFRTIISGRKISDMAQAKAWQDLGLLNKKDIITNKKTGEIKGWHDGAIRGTKQAYEDPLEFMEKTILPRLRDHGIGGKKVDITDPIKLGAALTTLFKNTKANAFVTAISTVVDRTRLKKDEGLIQKVLDTDKNYDSSLLNDPKLAKFAIVQAMRNLGASLSLPMMKPLAENLIAVARGVNHLSASLMEHPGAARALTSIAMGLAAITAIRLANAVTGIGGIALYLGNLAVAATLSLASGLLATARGIAAISAAATIGLARRLALSAGALMMMGRVGGIRAVLSMVGMSLAGLGLSVLRFPIVALRAAGLAMWGLVANPVGIAITAVVAALTALGIWVANNWGGLKSFFSSFADSFMKGLGPGASEGVSKIAGALKSAYDWISKLLGPIDETGTKWKSWGESAGAAAAKVVNALASLPGEIGKIAKDGWNALVNFDWASAGKAIVDGIVAGLENGAARIAGAVKGALSGAGTAVGGAVGKVGSSVKSGATWLHDKVFGPTEARAMGGAVAKGQPFLVGERGPELFVPSQDGKILTAGATAALSPSVDVSAISRTASLAQSTGRVLHASLDTTTKPVVDTAGLDVAIEKTSKLQMMLASINGSDIKIGDGIGATGGGAGLGGGGGGGSWNGKALGIPPGVGIGHSGTAAERAAYTKEIAKSLGMDPTTALRVSQSEGFYKYLGDHGRSFGEWQLFTGGGLGNIAMKHGINIRDPKTWKEQTKFALEWAKKHGWADWHGARRVGISNWQGIRGARAAGGPVDDGVTHLVGERGPELFTPGTGGRITSNDRTHALLARADKVAKSGRGGRQVNNVRGDTHVTNHWAIHGASNPAAVRRQVEEHFETLIRQMESDQRGLLSD